MARDLSYRTEKNRRLFALTTDLYQSFQCFLRKTFSEESRLLEILIKLMKIRQFISDFHLSTVT